MKKLVALFLFLSSYIACAQPVQQSGVVTPGHGACWAITGVLYDCGSPSGGISFSGAQTANDLVAINGSGSLVDSGINPITGGSWAGLQNFNGGATAPTRPVGDNTTNVATTAFMNNLLNNGFSITVTQNVNSTACAEPAGIRGPIYVCNDNNGTNAAGQALTFQGWVGNNPTGAIAANQAVAIFQYIDNTGGRQGIWAENFICGLYPVSLGGSQQINHCVELDVFQSQAAQNINTAFTPGAVSHGQENICTPNTSGSAYPCHVAFWVWASGDYANNSASTTQPWAYGLGLSRVEYAGVSCEINPSFPLVDTGTYFKQGCIWDQSASAVSYRIAGTHTSAIDISSATLTNFVNAGTTNVRFTGSGGATFAMPVTFSGNNNWFYQTSNCAATNPTGINTQGNAICWNFYQPNGEMDFVNNLDGGMTGGWYWITWNGTTMTRIAILDPTNNQFYPYTTNSLTLGAAANIWKAAYAGVYVSGGTAPTGNTGNCTGTASGGATAGIWTQGGGTCTAGSTIILSALPAAPTGYACDGIDRTTSGVVLQQTAAATNSATFTIRTTTVGGGDVIQFKCTGY